MENKDMILSKIEFKVFVTHRHLHRIPPIGKRHVNMIKGSNRLLLHDQDLLTSSELHMKIN